MASWRASREESEQLLEELGRNARAAGAVASREASQSSLGAAAGLAASWPPMSSDTARPGPRPAQTARPEPLAARLVGAVV